MIRCVSQQVKEILQSLVTQIVQIYDTHKHSCFLYLGSILVDEYATDSTCINGLLDMLQAFMRPTFILLKEENGLRNHPDTVDDFFRLCARFVQRAPVPFFQCAALPPIIQCGMMACSLDHREANTSVMKFFYDLVNAGKCDRLRHDYQRRKEFVKKLLDEYGQQFITNLIYASVFCLHTYMLTEVADVILEVLEFDKELMKVWLTQAINILPKTENGVITISVCQLDEFHTAVMG